MSPSCRIVLMPYSLRWKSNEKDMRRKARNRVSVERAEEIVRMALEGQIYDFDIDDQYSIVEVRYCDYKPLRVMRDILKKNLKGYSVYVERVYSKEAISQELYKLCTDGGWMITRNPRFAADADTQRIVNALKRDKSINFYP